MLCYTLWWCKVYMVMWAILIALEPPECLLHDIGCYVHDTYATGVDLLVSDYGPGELAQGVKLIVELYARRHGAARVYRARVLLD